MIFKILFYGKTYYVNDYKIKTYSKDILNLIKSFINKIIFNVKKFFLKIALDDYSRILISSVLCKYLPELDLSEREFKYKTPTVSLTEEEIKEIHAMTVKDIAYINNLIHNYL